MRVDAKGFRTSEVEPVDILVGREALVDVSLTLGDAVQTISVEATPPLIDATSGEASLNFDARKILYLPRLSAGLDRLALLAPGITPTGGNLSENGAIFSANGQRPRSNGFLLNGQDNSHRIPGGPRFLFGVIEAVSEYQIITNQFSAEYGLAQGSIVNVITRTGTNQFHGMGNWLHRNDAHFAALTNIQRRLNVSTPPKFIENRYGATLGGPVKKDKAFFYVYFDGHTVRRDLRVEAGVGQWTPTEEGLRTLAEAFPDSNTVAALRRYGPLTRPEGNPRFLPGFRLDSVRSQAGVPVSVQMGRLERYYKTPIDNLHAGGSIDFRFTSSDRVNVRYFHRESETSNSIAPISGYVVDGSMPMRSAAVTWTRIFSPAFVNELRFGYDYDVNQFADPAGAPYEEMEKNISEFAPPNGYVGFGLQANMPQISRQNSVQLADNVSHHFGRHALKYGFQWNRLWSDAGSRTFYNGQFQFDTLQNFVDNRPVGFNGVDGPLFTYFTFADQGYYFQDDFRVRSDLTLNLGVRFEVPSNFPRFAAEITNARERDPDTAIWNTALPLEARTSAATTRDWNNWAPRLGFAWNPRGASWLLGDRDTVIRGGYGISYDFPFGLLASSILPAAPLVLRYGLPGASASVPADVTGDAVRRVMQSPRGQDPRQLPVAEFSSDLRSSMAHSWSFGIQRRLRNAHMFEVRYAGNRALGLFQSRNANPNAQNYIDAGFPQVIPSDVRPGVNATCPACTGRVIPEHAAYSLLANTASSTYHGLQTRYEGRNLATLTLGVAYTWSRSIDNASDYVAGPFPQNPFDITAGERGLSAFDRAHVLAVHFVWDIPAFRSQHGLPGKIFGGWSVGGIIRYQSGAAATPQQRNTEPRSANDLAFNTAFGSTPDTRRPYSSNPRAALTTVGLVLPGGSLVDFYQPGRPLTANEVRWIYNNNASARLFGTPFGVGRSVVRGPAFHQTDLSMFKSIRVTEGLQLQLRLEAENAFNHPNLGAGGTFIESAGFLNPAETQAAPRRLAAGLRLMF
jgi:hypothetical protein